ncbi:hypothetical protein [Chryseobacterium sp. JUb7]|uniref:hypothetical protein n=1 Tax=Chryseobacterium sp. JUb7 TaxID=2940599 RepID=UPI002169B776|nr:hypothetical protein [Chryseobacterium sp. JUb7]MCS3533069.1 hypothetical protein [Chryseobacterium sp. JUb7]
MQDDEINLIAKVEKIDSTENSFVIYIKSKTGKGIFSVPKACDFKNNSYSYKLKKGRIYSRTEHQPKENIEKELVDGKLIWTSEMTRVFYEDCLNICGLYIDNIKL